MGSAVLNSVAVASNAAAGPHLGLLRIGAAQLALPVEALREVLPCPAQLAALPVVAEGLCGAIHVRGLVIPVLDLAVLLGLASPLTGERVIVVMRWQDGLLGILASEVCGMARLAPQALHELSFAAPGSRPHLATHSFQLNGGVVTLLSPEQIARLPGVPLVREPQARTGEHRHTAPALLFRCGSVHLGVDASSVEATLPRLAINDSSLRSALCLGVIEHRGFEVAVIDTLQLLGLTRQSRSAALGESALLVLRFPGGGLLALQLDEVSDIVPVAGAQIAVIPALAVQDSRLFRGALSSASADAGRPGQQTLLLEVAGLHQHEVLVALAGLSRQAAKPTRTANANALAGTVAGKTGGGMPGASYLTYFAGVESASPLAQISEIIDFPAALSPIAGRSAAVLGLFNHRGQAAPLVCLSTLLGRAGEFEPATARVLLVQGAGLTVGFVVQDLRSIEVAHWEEAGTAEEQGSASASASASNGTARRQSLVEVGNAAQRRMLPKLDLLQWVASLA